MHDGDARTRLDPGYDLYTKGRYGDALEFFTGVEGALPTDDIQERIETWKMQGNCLLNLGQETESFLKFNAAIVLAMLTGEEAAKCSLLNHIGNHHRLVKDFDEALKMVDKGIQLAEKLEKPEYLGKLHITRAVINQEAGRFNEAGEDFATAEKIFNDQKDEVGKAKAASLHASFLISMGRDKIEVAESKLKTSLAIGEQRKNQERITFCKMKLGLLYFKTGHFSKAKEFLEPVLDPSTDMNVENPEILIESNHVFAAIHRSEGNMEKTRDYLKRAEEIAKKYKHSDYIVKLALERHAMEMQDGYKINLEQITDRPVRDLFLSAEYMFAFGQLTSKLLTLENVSIDFGSLLNQYTKSIEQMLERKLLDGFDRKKFQKEKFKLKMLEIPYQNVGNPDRTISIGNWIEILLKTYGKDNESRLVIELNDFLREKTFKLNIIHELLVDLNKSMVEPRNEGVHQKPMSLKDCLQVRDENIKKINELISIFYKPADHSL